MNQRHLRGYRRLVWVSCPDVSDGLTGLHFQGHLRRCVVSRTLPPYIPVGVRGVTLAIGAQVGRARGAREGWC
jgi:hypothetical protein